MTKKELIKEDEIDLWELFIGFIKIINKRKKMFYALLLIISISIIGLYAKNKIITKINNYYMVESDIKVINRGINISGFQPDYCSEDLSEKILKLYANELGNSQNVSILNFLKIKYRNNIKENSNISGPTPLSLLKQYQMFSLYNSNIKDKEEKLVAKYGFYMTSTNDMYKFFILANNDTLINQISTMHQTINSKLSKLVKENQIAILKASLKLTDANLKVYNLKNKKTLSLSSVLHTQTLTNELKLLQILPFENSDGQFLRINDPIVTKLPQKSSSKIYIILLILGIVLDFVIIFYLELREKIKFELTKK